VISPVIAALFLPVHFVYYLCIACGKYMKYQSILLIHLVLKIYD